ncbi:uncharacterized protein LOC115996050 [Ipomoea triloba]|uniref:uncharacterized protein LOC115996050 n=1 Tax=Ipomoea triloba TaxID=35885 RepID=UPI00125CE980|nr:uncharacterized protein LOC115996050 [Ipomoea triloba]
MKIITWNCRGIADGRARKHVKQLLNSTKADILCLLEIRSPKADRMINMIYSLGFTNHFIVDPIGFAGGFLLLWNQGRVKINMVGHSSQAIHTKICLEPNDCFVTFSHVRPNPLAKNDQWGSVDTNNRNMERFVDAYNACGLIDLDNFPEAKVVVLPRLHSDHSPIMFMDEAGRPPAKHLRPNRFEAAWLAKPDYEDIWKDATRNMHDNIEVMIEKISKNSLLWNKKVFGNIFHRKRHLEEKIKKIQMNSNYQSSRDLQNLERELINDLNKILDQEETHWFQKSRQDWIKDGDRNTRFYHNVALSRRNKNHIFQVVGWRDSRYLESVRISTSQASNLIRRAYSDEVKKLFFGMKKFGSPRPDGIQVIFYQHFWEDVGPALTTFVNQALGSGSVHKSLLKAFVTLIPKKDIPDSETDFKPITLLNVAFKVISKVIVNRMRPIMCNIIGLHQNSFLPGRSTLDNIILT